MKLTSRRLTVGDHGKEVKTLQKELQRLGYEILPDEIAIGIFRKSTYEGVRDFQRKRPELPQTGDVDQTTAQVINAALLAGDVPKRSPVLPSLILPLNDRGAEVQALHAQFAKLGYAIPRYEQQHQIFGVGTRDVLRKFQAQSDLLRTGMLDEKSRVALTRAVTTIEAGQPRIEGRLFFDHGMPAEKLTIRLYDKKLWGKEKKLAEIETDDKGYYVLPYNTGNKPANLELRAVGADGKEIPLSATKFNARVYETLNLVAPRDLQQQSVEYDRLTGDLKKELGGLAKLATIKETSERQDLSLLHRATGWDARLIALAAMAAKLSADHNIPQEALYGMFRAGLPTDPEELARVNTGAIEKALKKVREVGVVNLTPQQLAQAKKAFETFARKTRSKVKAPGALSSSDEFLDKASLTTAQRNLFEDLYFTHRGTPDELWQKAHDQGISDSKIDGLRLQGKLAFLTVNNAPLTASLQQEVGSSSKLTVLVNKNFYHATAWQDHLKDLAGNNDQKLEKLIPPAYIGETIAARLESYAADLARKVRLSFPTQVIGHMIENDELRLGPQHNQLKGNVRTFLMNAEGLGFKLGHMPVNSFVNAHDAVLFQGIPQAKKAMTIDGMKILQRVYQMTPSNESMQAVLDLGFTSAHDITAFPQEVFLDRFAYKFPSREQAGLVYRKSHQISAVTYNFFTMAKQLESTPTIYSMSPSIEVIKNTKKELIKHYPTLKSIFGSLDFCECEHCRSILSPAAYLVDLFQFLNPEQKVWESFLIDWKNKHNGEAYTDKYKKPYDALVARREDLPHLSLTCENTHTAMPYIDIVNEILEYYVDKGNLDKQTVHDTGEATTPELLAEPQHILPTAYDKLKLARYPLNLPFDLWLETVRKFFDHFETPLWKALEVFRPTDALFPPAVNPQAYYRSHIFSEYLGISPTDYAVFTDSTPLATWHELYGFNTKAEAFAALKSAKVLSRRLGVTYKELVELVQASFINPQLDAFVVLRKLGLEVHDVFRYKKAAGYAELTAEEIGGFEDRLNNLTTRFNPGGDAGGFNAKTWLDTAWANGEFNQVLVLATPDTGCDFERTTLLFASHKSNYVNGDDVYGDNNTAYGLVFLKFNLFVRLWKKLGWPLRKQIARFRSFYRKTPFP